MIKYIIAAFLAFIILLQHNQIKQINDITELQTQVIESQTLFISETVEDIGYMRRYKIPYEYLQLVLSECATREVDPDFIIRLMYVESGYDKNARSAKYAYGLMQLLYPTACEVDPSLESYYQLFDPEVNVRIGVAYFKMLLLRYGGDYQLAAIAYNRGIGRMDSELAEGGLIDWYYVKIESIETVQ